MDKTTGEIEAIFKFTGVNTDVSNGERAGKPVEAGDYDAIVAVVRGPFKGRIGYCDDQSTKTRGVVYFGPPLLGENAEILYSQMRYATDVQIVEYNTLGNGEFSQRRAIQRVREAVKR